MIANFRREKEPIGSGSFGNVYKAKWNGRPVAAKELRGDLFEPHDRNGHVAKFEAECRILQRLQHKNVVQLLEFVISHSSPPVLITELLDRDLGSSIGLLYPEKIPFPKTVSIMLDVAEGLAYLHERNPPIVHRDLACKNVLLTEQRQAKIADLGLAKVFPRNKRKQYASPVPGTPAYAAPETYPTMACGNASSPKVEYGVKIDIFSFGIMLMEVINGSRPVTETERPFTTDGRRILEKERRKSDIRKMSGHKLKEIVLRCIQDSSEERPSAGEVSELLQNEWSKIQQKQKVAGYTKGPKLEIAVLGQSGAGKSCLVSRFVDHNFNREVETTIGIINRFSRITLHGKEFHLQVVDTAGEEKYHSCIPQSIRKSQGVVLVFDLTNRSSFREGIRKMLEIVKAHTPDRTSLILVGNKADLADQDALQSKREITKEEAENLAQKLGIHYVETSAFSGRNIEAVFELITNEIYETLDLSDIDVYVPGASREHIKVANEDAPRDRSFLEKIGDCFRSWFN
ncbi:hypothetical protein ACROYT_G008247 [Oculina patagonica]